MPHTRLLRTLLPGLLLLLALTRLRAQDTIPLELSGRATNGTRIAVADFKAGAASPQSGSQTTGLRDTFDTTLSNDLANAGIFELVSKSVAPQATPGSPAEINLAQWSAAPALASMVAFGSLGVSGSQLSVNGYLFDVKNTQFPQVLAKQYNEEASAESARLVAHRFADEIIFRLGGTPGIAETKIYFVHGGGGTKEIWAMDYDGANQHQVTHLDTIALSPRPHGQLPRGPRHQRVRRLDPQRPPARLLRRP